MLTAIPATVRKPHPHDGTYGVCEIRRRLERARRIGDTEFIEWVRKTFAATAWQVALGFVVAS